MNETTSFALLFERVNNSSDSLIQRRLVNFQLRSESIETSDSTGWLMWESRLPSPRESEISMIDSSDWQSAEQYPTSFSIVHQISGPHAGPLPLSLFSRAELEIPGDRQRRRPSVIAAITGIRWFAYLPQQRLGWACYRWRLRSKDTHLRPAIAIIGFKPNGAGIFEQLFGYLPENINNRR